MKEKMMLCSDLDGTLLTDDKEISEKNIDAINRMLSEGHYFVISTGRPVASGREIVKQLGLTKPGCYMIAQRTASYPSVLFRSSTFRNFLKVPKRKISTYRHIQVQM